ncbi:Putative Arsenite efflux transporter ArsB-like, puative [Penicillium brasilianum]|uniref:Putative Arsenite efflux transporter ArsB-like, puative n=1 Tax=Penicillium brasilianum TaxID=104259 RepID=A0A0F7TKA4_PENBI|nr:Putative Arsenite efflux transporter ArsB-like, puative [Penicillium brasilianum]
MAEDLDTSKIKNWRSIITLIVFVITNIIVLFPFNIPIYVPRWFYNATLDTLSALRIIPSRKLSPHHQDERSVWVRLNVPLNFVTAPLAADLFLLAILAIGRKEVHDGTIGADNISPIDIMAFFLTLAYIAISIDASGLIRWLAFKVLQRGGGVGHRLFFYLYAFFFGLGSFIGNDPIILSGTAFLAYMTRVSSNIVHPRAWIHSQFAVANIASAVLVSSNPTNLVLAGAFEIKFIVYTANMIVPVVATAIVIFPFLLYIIFADESLIPYSIQMHELSEEAKARKPVNPNIPHARGNAEEEEEMNNENGKLLSLEEIMNPFLDKGGAAFGAVIMAATLITLLAINAASQSGQEHPVFWVTLPGAFVMFCWDLASGWIHRHETREIAAKGRREVETARAERDRQESLRNLQEQADDTSVRHGRSGTREISSQSPSRGSVDGGRVSHDDPESSSSGTRALPDGYEKHLSELEYSRDETFSKRPVSVRVMDDSHKLTLSASPEPLEVTPTFAVDEEKRDNMDLGETNSHRTLVSLTKDLHRWLQETFPTVTVVVSHMPFPLVPFALSMFVLVQALVTKGWVPVFAYGWDHWVDKTGTVGAIGGMGFLSVILCNFAGTNIGTTILLSRVIQAWQQIHINNGIPISDRTFWASVYSMAIGVNYGAFSTAFSASLAGLLWRDILGRKHIRVGSIEFARVNLPIIAIAMAVGCTVLVGQIYITRKPTPYDA